jgi:hypothetical protein
MITHQFNAIETMNVRIGIPGSLTISSTSEQPSIKMQLSSCDNSRIELNINDDTQHVEISLNDRFRGSNGPIYSDIEISLPQNMIESLNINAVCSKMSIHRISVNKLRIHNVRGKLGVLPESHIHNLKLMLVETNAVVIFSSDIERAFIKAIQCNTVLKTNGFRGCIHIDAVGATARINETTIQNGHFVWGDVNNNNKLSCDVISGRFSLDQG